MNNNKTCETCKFGAYNRVEDNFKCFKHGQFIPADKYKVAKCKDGWETNVEPPKEFKPKRGKKKWNTTNKKN